jgi:hypothetical protein
MLQGRIFPLFSAIQSDPEAAQVLATDLELAQSARLHWNAVQQANTHCGQNVACKSKTLRFTPAEIDSLAAALDRVYVHSNALQRFVHERLQPRAFFTRSAQDSDEQILLQSWRNAARTINHILDTYGSGIAPRYRQIDSISYPPQSEDLAYTVAVIQDQLRAVDSGSDAKQADEMLFYLPSLRFSLRLLQANRRDEAGRYLPLESRANASALSHRTSIDWKKYPYSVILVPGYGPEFIGVALAPVGKERLRMAVEAYREGAAPYILLSGGFVHPAQTPYCEAMEMKRYLMEVYGIPESALLVEPQARHTTTNLRNASRLIFDDELPSDRPMLVISDLFHINAIASTDFAVRNQQELGYIPVTLGKRISGTRIEATPLVQSQFRDGTDPLDP